MTAVTATPAKRAARAPLYMQISAWSIPVLLVSGFAMVALVPVLVVLIGSATDPRSRFLRWWSAGVAALYVVPLGILNVRPDPAPSLTKDMHPVFLVLIVVGAAALLVRIYTRRAR